MEPPVHPDNERPPVPPVQPNTGGPKAIGVLNIVFGTLLLLCAICSSINLAMQSAMGPMMQAQQQQLQQAMKAEREQQLQELRDLEQAAKDEKEKANLQARQKALQAQPVPKMPDFTKFTQNAHLTVYAIADIVTGLILNIAMIISGIGLLALKEWGRVTALWVAGLKIVRLVALYSIFAVVVVPVLVRSMTSMFEEMFDELAKAGPPGARGPGPAELSQMAMGMGTMMTAFAIGMIVLGVIYPAIVLIVLTRPSVKAACAPRSPGPGIRNQGSGIRDQESEIKGQG
jgi:hypothetical protein